MTQIKVDVTNTVTSEKGAPGGDVTVLAGDTQVGQGTLTSGTCNITLEDMGEGTYNLTVQYHGDDYHDGGTFTLENVVIEELDFYKSSNWTTDGLSRTGGTVTITDNKLSFSGTSSILTPVYYKTNIQSLQKYMPLSFTFNKNNTTDGRFGMGLILPASNNNGTDCVIGYLAENMSRKNGSTNTLYNEYTNTKGTPSKSIKSGEEQTVVLNIIDDVLHIYYKNCDNTYTAHILEVGVSLEKVYLFFGNYTTTYLYISDFNTNVALPTVDTTGGANIDFYNQDNWVGTPTIDSTNNKVTMNSSNITYYCVSSFNELINNSTDNTISITYYHNGRDGRKALGLYDPVIHTWIGYATPSPSGTDSQGINEETGYKITDTTVTDSNIWMRDGQESPLIFKYDSENNNLILSYTAHDGTENVSCTIPISTANLDNYYIAFYDNRGYGMYIRDITFGGGEGQ